MLNSDAQHSTLKSGTQHIDTQHIDTQHTGLNGNTQYSDT
jgi:hypothetical protein